MEQRRSTPGQPIEERPVTADQNEILGNLIDEARRQIDAIPVGDFNGGPSENKGNPLDD